MSSREALSPGWVGPRDVLVVERDPAIRAELAKAIASERFGWKSAPSLDHALQVSNPSNVSAVVADVNSLGGFEAGSMRLQTAIRQLRSAMRDEAGEPAFDIVVIVTGEEDDAERHAWVLDAGADLYVPSSVAKHAPAMSLYLRRLTERVQWSVAKATRERAAMRLSDRPTRANDVFDLPTGRFRSGSGRIHAGHVADALGVPLVRVAEAIQVLYQTVHKTPDSGALQESLAPIANTLAMLDQVFEGDDTRLRAWLRSEQPALGGRTPLDALLMPGGAAGVEQFVTGAWLGESD